MIRRTAMAVRTGPRRGQSQGDVAVHVAVCVNVDALVSVAALGNGADTVVVIDAEEPCRKTAVGGISGARSRGVPVERARLLSCTAYRTCPFVGALTVSVTRAWAFPITSAITSTSTWTIRPT